MLLPVIIAGTVGFVHSPPSCQLFYTQSECSLDRFEVKEIDLEVAELQVSDDKLSYRVRSFYSETRY